MSAAANRVAKESTIEWVPVADLKVSEMAQRRLHMPWVNAHVAEFNPGALGFLVVNERSGGDRYVIDGQHRKELLKAVGWGDQSIQCEVYRGLTLREEAAEFLRRNDRRAVRPFDNFRVKVTAEDPDAVAIARILASEGLALSMGEGDNKLHAVGALEAVYGGMGIASKRESAQALTRTLRTLRDAFGPASSSFQGSLVEGVGLVFLRHKDIDREVLTQKMAKIPGGAAGLVGRGRAVREVKGRAVSQCVAAVVVDFYNQSRRTGRLADWWS